MIKRLLHENTRVMRGAHGLGLFATGPIKKGTAGAVKNYRVTVTAKNGAGATASATFNWQVTG